MHHVYVRALALGCFHSLISTQTFQGPDCVTGQLGGDKECPFSGITKSVRVWRRVPESDARSVGKSLCVGDFALRVQGKFLCVDNFALYVWGKSLCRDNFALYIWGKSLCGDDFALCVWGKYLCADD